MRKHAPNAFKQTICIITVQVFKQLNAIEFHRKKKREVSLNNTVTMLLTVITILTSNPSRQDSR